MVPPGWEMFFGGGEVVRSARFERATVCLEGRCSIQLSYERLRQKPRVVCLKGFPAQVKRQPLRFKSEGKVLRG